MAGFQRAVKIEAKLRMALAGPSGSGKTYTALTVATALADGGPVAVIDTERGSASKYADLFGFVVLELDSFHPDKYVEAIREAEAGGYAVLVIDSLSHAWTGRDGLLEQVERLAKLKHGGNSFKAWADATPIQNRFIDALTGAKLHVVATMRSKTEYVVENNERGKATPRKVGTAPIQRDGMEYEFDIFGELDQDNTLVIHKSRCPQLAGAVIPKPGKPLADTLRAWLAGAPAADRPAPRKLPEKMAPFPQAVAVVNPADDPAPNEGSLTLADFLKTCRQELDLAPPQVMEKLGVKSLTGLNLDQALAQVRADLRSTAPSHVRP